MEWFESLVRVNDTAWDHQMKPDQMLYFLIDSSGARSFENNKGKAEHMSSAPYLFYLTGWQVDIFPRRLRVQYKYAAKLGDAVYPMVQKTAEGYVVALCSEKNKPYALVEFAE